MREKIRLPKIKFLFIIDLILIPVFILVIYSGLKLHVMGHIQNHDIWAYWAHFHIVTSIISLLVGGLHIKLHWGWYKGFMKVGLGKKSRITLILSILFLTLTLTGIMMIIFIDGGNSSIGLWHYKLGLIMIPLLIGHTIKRFPLLRKGLKS